MSLEHASSGGSAAAASADEADWNAVYASHLPRVYNYFRFRFGSDKDVEDLTARTFEKAWRGRDRYRSDVAGFSTWLFRIAQNVAVDYLRTWRPHLPIEAAGNVASDDSPDLTAERASDLARLGALTARLSSRDRELIALKYGAGASNRLIARLTGLSESNVGTILHRTVAALRERW